MENTWCKMIITGKSHKIESRKTLHQASSWIALHFSQFSYDVFLRFWPVWAVVERCRRVIALSWRPWGGRRGLRGRWRPPPPAAPPAATSASRSSRCPVTRTGCSAGSPRKSSHYSWVYSRLWLEVKRLSHLFLIDNSLKQTVYVAD